MPELIDLEGQRFGHLTVLRHAGTKRGGSSHWETRCVCGTEFVTTSQRLRLGQVKSCGCFRAELGRARRAERGERAKATGEIALERRTAEMLAQRELEQARRKRSWLRSEIF